MRTAWVFIILMAGLVALSNELVQYPVSDSWVGDYWTWAAFTYPFTFLLCDLCVRANGTATARVVVAIGFVVGVALSVFIDVRIAVASGSAYLVAQMLDVEIFNRLNKRALRWWVPPFVSSAVVSVVDTLLFFSIAFYGTGVPWVTLSIGDYIAKITIVTLSLLPYRLLLPHLRHAG